MSVADEIRKLAELRDSGALTAEEFEAAKARLLGGLHSASDAPSAPAPGPTTPPRTDALRRHSTDRWLGGVCGGLARYTHSESWIWRLVFAVSLCFVGTGALFYLLLWIFVPLDTSS
jgi:phage shock protein C